MSTTLADGASATYAIHGRGGSRPVESAPDQHLESRVITSSLTISIAAPASETRRALRRLDMTAPGLRALEATGLHDRVVFQAGGLVWRPAGIRGRVNITAEAHVEPSETETSFLQLTTRFSPSDDRAAARLLESWAVIGPLADALVRQSARAVKAHAEDDLFEPLEAAQAA